MGQLLLLRLLCIFNVSVLSTFQLTSNTHETRITGTRCRCLGLQPNLDELDQDPFQLFFIKFQESLDSLSFTRMVLSENIDDDTAVDDCLKGCKEITARTIKIKKSDIMCQLTFKFDSHTQTKNLNYSETPSYIESLLKERFKKATLATVTSDIELRLKRGRGKLKETLKVRILK